MVTSQNAQQVALKCSAGMPAPLDPRLYSGAAGGSWHLISASQSSDGAQLYAYQMIAPTSELHFE